MRDERQAPVWDLGGDSHQPYLLTKKGEQKQKGNKSRLAGRALQATGGDWEGEEEEEEEGGGDPFAEKGKPEPVLACAGSQLMFSCS